MGFCVDCWGVNYSIQYHARLGPEGLQRSRSVVAVTFELLA